MRITIQSGAAAGREFDVSRQMIVGRSPSCDIHIPDAGLSSAHATVRPIEGGIEVADLDSTNGTFINGFDVHSPRAVYPGDELRFASILAAITDDAPTEVGSAATILPDRRPSRWRPWMSLLAGGLTSALIVGGALWLTGGFSR